MIVDTLDRADAYAALHPLFPAAFAFLRSWDPSSPDGRIELEGDSLIAMPQSYQTALPSQKKWEAHRRYIDIQYIVEGSEGISVLPIQRLEPNCEYNETKDVIFFHAPESSPPLLPFQAGDFAIFYPWDAHRPSCQLQPDTPIAVRKIVVKVEV